MGLRRLLRTRGTRAHARWLVAALAVLGVVAGIALDGAGWLADQPLTGNVVAGILGAPATVLLALLVFERLEAAQREQDWVDKRQAVLRRFLVPQLTALRNTLGMSWPLETAGQFDAALAALLDEYAALSRRPTGATPSRPLDARLQRLTRDVAELTDRGDPEVTLATVVATLPTLDLVVHQAEAPHLAEAAVDLRTVASAYAAAVEAAGHEARRFAAGLWNLAFREWRWEDTGKRFVVPVDGGEVVYTAGGISMHGFQYQRQLAQARNLADACRTLLRSVESTLRR
jgi:hypothetical protein